MSANAKPVSCPECDDFDRRDFIRVLGGSAAALGGLAAVPAVARAADDAPTKAAKPAKPAEALIKELYATYSDEQKKELVQPFTNNARFGMYNAPLMGKTIGKSYTKPQQELLETILKSICSGDDGWHQISRAGKWDASGSFQNCGALLFGEPKDGEKWAWLFTGHHLTVRCDGNSEEGAAFGGPMYYGHTPNGYSPNNVWYYQTKSVLSVFDMLDGDQRKKAVVKGSPGEQAGSVKFRKDPAAMPGILYADLSADQKKLVEKVMRDVLSPYRKEDADEVMEIVKKNGGMEKIHLAFYHDKDTVENKQWDFWRLEGPGFVWNYRVLPHVHTFVNISSKLA